MKNIFISLLGISVFFSCQESGPVTTQATSLDPVEDLAGYLDGNSQILFVTPEDREEVLDVLEASLLDSHLYAIDVLLLDGEPLFLCISVMGVETPAIYIGLSELNIAYVDIFESLDSELGASIESPIEEIEYNVLIAVGSVFGKLSDLADNYNKNLINAAFTEKLPEVGPVIAQARGLKVQIEELKKPSATAAKNACQAAKQKLIDNDPEGGFEELRKLAENLRKELLKDLKPKFMVTDIKGNTSTCEFIRPKRDLLERNIKYPVHYKVFKNAKCQEVKKPKIFINCQPFLTPGKEKRKLWKHSEQFSFSQCKKGSGLCVEKELTSAITWLYADSLCTKLVSTKGMTEIGCN
ncbi:MAG: hypothetical protein AAF502_06800 [Bacteroidota bacterium]